MAILASAVTDLFLSLTASEIDFYGFMCILKTCSLGWQWHIQNVLNILQLEKKIQGLL